MSSLDDSYDEIHDILPNQLTNEMNFEAFAPHKKEWDTHDS